MRGISNHCKLFSCSPICFHMPLSQGVILIWNNWLNHSFICRYISLSGKGEGEGEGESGKANIICDVSVTF